MWFQNHNIRLETNDKHKGWNSPVKLHFHVCLSWAPSEVRQLVSDSQCKHFRIAALNQEHALCTWMWIIISKLAYVVLCLHFTLTHFFCLTTPLSDRWVSIYESLSQPSLNSLPLAYQSLSVNTVLLPLFHLHFPLERKAERMGMYGFQHWLGCGWLASCPTEAETWWFLYMACCYHDLLLSGREKKRREAGERSGGEEVK